jgi:hypothetical protein
MEMFLSSHPNQSECSNRDIPATPFQWEMKYGNLRKRWTLSAFGGLYLTFGAGECNSSRHWGEESFLHITKGPQQKSPITPSSPHAVPIKPRISSGKAAIERKGGFEAESSGETDMESRMKSDIFQNASFWVQVVQMGLISSSYKSQ